MRAVLAILIAIGATTLSVYSGANIFAAIAHTYLTLAAGVFLIGGDLR